MALELGKKYDCDLFKLEVSALLHDITKYYETSKQIKIIEEYYPNSTEILKEYNEHIYHGFTARIIAKEKYHIKDIDILDAITYHTVGKPNMSIYEKIIFIADYTEPNRTYENCIKARNLLKDNIDLAVYTAINDSIILYESTNDNIPKIAYEARDYYKQLLEEQNGKNTSNY
jgi:predicted HD superfamily hydrolase involved in NAD metabolism